MAIRILYILNCTSRSSGANKAFFSLLKGMQSSDYELAVVVPDAMDVYSDLQRMGIKTYVLDFVFNIYPVIYRPKTLLAFVPRLFSTIIKNSKAKKRLAQIVDEFQPDIIHSNSSVIGVGFDVAKKKGIPHIYHFREYADKIPLHFLPSQASFLKKIQTDNSFIICIVKDMIDHYHLTANKNAIAVYDGVSYKRSFTESATNGSYFLFVGRIEPIKGLLELMKAYKGYVDRAPEHVIPLWVVGQESHLAYTAKVKSYIRDNGLEEYVVFLGERNDMDALYQSALAMIISSLYEGFGLCMPEAMFNSCLCIGRNVAGTKEQFDNGVALSGSEIGLRFETEEELSAILYDVSTHPEGYYEMRKRALSVVNQLYSIESNVRNVQSLYETIINNRK